MPNAFAYLMLLAWPLIVLVMFRRMPVERALIWSILGGYLLLPPVQANFNLPMIPAFDKVSIPNLSALFVVVAVLGRRIRLMPDSWIGRVLLVLFVISPLATMLTNTEFLRFGVIQLPGITLVPPESEGVPAGLPGLGLRDAFSAVANQAIFILPFFLARELLATPKALREVMLALMLGGLFYALPALFEVRMSPQLNTWIYGFFQHDFSQMMRPGGFRPIVFLPHGLWMAFFAMMTVIAALALTRFEPAEARPRYLAAALLLFAVLVLCRSVGPLVLFAGLLPLVLLAPARLQLSIAAMLGLVALAYPLLRGGGLVPVEALVAWAETIEPERAASLRFRFDNEDLLLGHAAQKPWFGWGGWDRNHVHDMLTGQRLTVADGRWIIVIGLYGWLGYVVEFGLLALPLVLLALQARRSPSQALSPYAGPLALLLGANMIDLLPNATLIPLTWLVAGAMLGHAEWLRKRRAAPAAAGAAENPAGHGQLPAPPRPRRTIL
jgi:hypothetical protein